MPSKPFWPVEKYSTLSQLEEGYCPPRGRPDNTRIKQLLEDRNTVLEQQGRGFWLAYSGNGKHPPEAIQVKINSPALQLIFHAYALLTGVLYG